MKKNITQQFNEELQKHNKMLEAEITALHSERCHLVSMITAYKIIINHMDKLDRAHLVNDIKAGPHYPWK